MENYLWLIPLGFAVGAFGTMIGAGGGFILAPLLLLLYPAESPQIVTSISLAVVFFNAFSGSIAYARRGRIDYRSGLLFSLATIPGAIAGAFTTAYLPRRIFDTIFGLLMIAAAIFLFLRQARQQPDAATADQSSPPAAESFQLAADKKRLGVIVSILVGYISSLLGIGGGIIHVPMMVHMLSYPVHIATATSHFTLAIMTLTGTIVHILTGAFHHGVRRTIALSIGVLAGAQLGARLSDRIREGWIIRILAIALAFVGIRILLQAF